MIKSNKKLEKFEKLKFKYYIIKYSEKDSLFGAAITFLVNFINKIILVTFFISHFIISIKFNNDLKPSNI